MTETATAPVPVATTGELAAWHASTGFPAVCTPTGLALPDDLTFDEWQAFASPILGAARASQWWVGDWIVAGKTKWGSLYTTAVDVTGLSYDTLRHATKVCRAFPIGSRRPNLPFAHHRVVCDSAPPEEWDRWLDAAVEHGWSRDELRAAIREARTLPADSTDGAPPPGRVARFVLPEAHAPAALRVVEWAERVLRDHLSADEAEVLGELLEALRKAAA